jgi:hypothetical protein
LLVPAELASGRAVGQATSLVAAAAAVGGDLVSAGHGRSWLRSCALAVVPVGREDRHVRRSRLRWVSPLDVRIHDTRATRSSNDDGRVPDTGDERPSGPTSDKVKGQSLV